MSTTNRTVILIPHYNNLAGLTKSLQCIYHRTGIDVLIIDDGSKIESRPEFEYLNSILNPKVTLNILYLPQNRGITEALNHGLNYILKKDTHEFIARIDCGDTCVKNRFSLQEEYMNEHKDISLVGSWVKWVADSTEKELYSYKPPTESKKIKKRMSIRCNVIHPSVMYRVSIVKKLGIYPVTYNAAEDYAYFFEMAKHSKVANIPKFLTQTEHNSEGISARNKKVQNKSKLKIVMKYGRKDLFLLYGILWNIILIYTPARLIFRVKSQLK